MYIYKYYVRTDEIDNSSSISEPSGGAAAVEAHAVGREIRLGYSRQQIVITAIKQRVSENIQCRRHCAGAV